MLNWLPFADLKLDIVGIVAVLGEGSIARNAQVSALGWHHILPRLLPAPQALLKHGHERRLPTTPGTVVGAYSGNVKFELNFFCQLLHADNLKKNEVELVEVRPRKQLVRPTANDKVKTKFENGKDTTGNITSDKKVQSQVSYTRARSHAYEAKGFGLLALASVLGCAMSIGMSIMAFKLHDGFALVAIVLLSITSSVVGFASWWRLDFRGDPPKTQTQAERQRLIPDSDVVIYYPRQGAFRIVRCEEYISRLYFRTEECEHVLGDTSYRIFALTASVFLMIGLLCMSNSQLTMQLAFAAAYILLNALYWVLSALNPTGGWGHWRPNFECTPIRVVSPSPLSKLGVSLRVNTNNSFQNVPVLTQEPISPTKAESDLMVPATTSTKPSTGTARESSGTQVKMFDIRQRRRTFRDNPPASAAPPLTEGSFESEPTSYAIDGPPKPRAQKSESSAQIQDNTSQGVKRQTTVDLEGQKPRLYMPWGSIRRKVVKWLDERRLIAKQPINSQTNNVQQLDTFTTALWKAIIVTGSTRWLDQTHIAPNNEVWTTWIEEAGKRAKTWTNQRGERVAAYTVDDDGSIQLPSWDYQGRLSDLFAKEKDIVKRRPPPAQRLFDVITEERARHAKVQGISSKVEAHLRKQAQNARRRAATNRSRRANLPIISEGSHIVNAHDRTHSHDFATNGSL